MCVSDDGKVPAQHGEDAPGAEVAVQLDAWFLNPKERGNPSTLLDERRGTAWSTGNRVDVLVHGSTYFARLLSVIESLGTGDTLLFTDWRGDPDERLDAAGPTVAAALSDAAKRGAAVNGLVWRSHWDKLAFSAEENRRLGTDIEEAGGCCLLDMRVRLGGSHHQKFVVIRHGEAPDGRDVAFVGGIDLCHSRRDDATHAGDPQRQPMAAVYGERPPWHDVQLEMHGPVVGDVEFVFRERWNDPQPLSRAPWRKIADRLHREAIRPRRLAAQADDPPTAGTHAVQLLRTYADRGTGYPFAPTGERSVARGFHKALRRARSFIYVEDQYLWSRETASVFAAALRNNPSLRLIAVVPRFPDQDGRFSRPPNDIGRADAMRVLREAGGRRVAIYDVENAAAVPIYVHAKVCIIDDVWASVGSANLNRRSWSHDSELTCAVIDETLDVREPSDPAGLGDGARVFARDLRLRLAREHLERADGDDDGLLDPVEFFDTMADAAARLDQWHARGRAGERPRGRLRPHHGVRLDRTTRAWARPLYRLVYDPDGRPWRLRRSGTF
jgi:phosphatidylserine/phosphatidylglycerophosphate/cardiolipin synthase-like enzyme